MDNGRPNGEHGRPNGEGGRTGVTVEEYVRFREDGFLIVRGVLQPDEVRELLDHVDELVAADGELLRVHMLHRRLEIHERYLLHPRLVDLVAGLIGPDVLALQTMLFVKGPGSPGQGYHQDSFHIITEPDTLLGAWIALDRADEENGCLWVTSGSQHEPVYPDADESKGHGGDFHLADIHAVSGADDPDESRNDLVRIAAKYPGRERPAIVDPGDAVFFGGHVLHRSHENRSATRSRRAFVGHYCNARSHVPWESEHGPHLLARGSTHLPSAQPRFLVEDAL
jgi:ectoine hydroxylase-related dioxygenase (phytanoyl-CoA dioxygenase family)